MKKTKLHYLKQMRFLSPFGQSDFSMKQHKVCTFKWASSKIAISDLYLVFSCTVTYLQCKISALRSFDAKVRYCSFQCAASFSATKTRGITAVSKVVFVISKQQSVSAAAKKKVNLSLQTGRLPGQIGVCIRKRTFCSNIICSCSSPIVKATASNSRQCRKSKVSLMVLCM